MRRDIRDRYERYRVARTTWDPDKGGRMPIVRWRDAIEVDLGEDVDGDRFARISDRMLNGRY